MTLYTWGYGNRPATALQAILAERPHLIAIDTRLYPSSPRRPEWGKDALKAALGDRYLWCGAILGNAVLRKVAAPPGKIWAMNVSVGMVTDHLQRMAAWMDRNGYAPLFICCEQRHHGCHRTDVAELAAQVAWPGASIEHLD